MRCALCIAIALAALQPSAHAQSAERGRAVYMAKCQACHGASGRGDGPAARALPKTPADFTARAFWVGRTDAKLTATISSGRPGSPMRAFPMTDESVGHLIAYLRTFQPTG